jgi:opacity protein-like surface antigen
MQTFTRWSLFFLGLAFTSTSFADESNLWYFTLGGGYDINSLNTKTTIAPLIQSTSDTYSPTPYSNIGLGIGMVELGKIYSNDSILFPKIQFGVGWEYTQPFTINGSIEPLSLPQAIYNYSEDFSTQGLYLMEKFNLFQLGILSPYIKTGVGISLSQVSNYQETYINSTIPQRLSPAFQDNSYYSFAYMASAGIDIKVAPTVDVNLGYAYNNPVDVQTGDAQDYYTQPVALKNTFYSNFFYLSVDMAFQPTVHN